MLTKSELDHLQELSALSLSDKEVDVLWSQLSNIVDFLSKLQDVTKGELSNINGHTLELSSWINNYVAVDDLFKNSIHEKMWNTIVISSVVDH